MCHDRFIIRINLFSYKRFEDGGCAYKNTGSSYVNFRMSRILFVAEQSWTTTIIWRQLFAGHVVGSRSIKRKKICDE